MYDSCSDSKIKRGKRTHTSLCRMAYTVVGPRVCLWQMIFLINFLFNLLVCDQNLCGYTLTKIFISSSPMAKSNISAFSKILSCLLDLGMVM